mmetsp:Transcript_37452/g.89729  ORF Transcript_37452/g.89729 Transcript_37452/m.89729 type:complete len:288 (+) Transcript_37452:1360-2223(+)
MIDSLVRARTFPLTAGDKTTVSVSSPATSGSTEKAFRSTSVPFLGVTKSAFPRTSLADELTTILRSVPPRSPAPEDSATQALRADRARPRLLDRSKVSRRPFFAFLLDRLPAAAPVPCDDDPGVSSMSSDSNVEALERPPRFLDLRVETWLKSTTLTAIFSKDLVSSACPRRVMSMEAATSSLPSSFSWLPSAASVPSSVDFRRGWLDGFSAVEEANRIFRIRRLRLLLPLEEWSSGVSTCNSIGDPGKLEALLKVTAVSSPLGCPTGGRRRRRKLCRLAFLAEGVH